MKIEKEFIEFEHRRGIRFSIRGKEITIGLKPFKTSGYWCIWRKTMKGRSTGTYITPINPIPYKWNRIKLRIMRWILKEYHGEHLRCHGCGEGLIKYSIKDPNKRYDRRGVKRWLVGECCKNFYDFHFSARKVKLE